MSASRTLNDDLRMEQATISSSPLQASAIATATRPHHHPPDGDRARSTPTHALWPFEFLTFWLRSAPHHHLAAGGASLPSAFVFVAWVEGKRGGRARTRAPSSRSEKAATDARGPRRYSVAAGSVRQELTSGTACQRGRSRSRGDLQCGPRGWSWRRPGLCAVVEAGEHA
jgi:hypothetical protein